MYCKVVLFYFFLMSTLISDDYILEALGDFTRKEIKVNNLSFTIFVTNFKWKYSYGQFGEGYCIGHMENINNELDLYNLCENTDSEGEKFWLQGERNSGESRGVGTMTYVKTEGKYKKFLDRKCNYGVSWYSTDSFYLKQICKF